MKKIQQKNQNNKDQMNKSNNIKNRRKLKNKIQ